jgi:hypothetical protein
VVLEAQRARTVQLQRVTGGVIPWVFHGAGRPIKDFRAAWKRMCRAAGVPRSATMQMVGHKTESVYCRYAISDAMLLREAGEKLSTFHKATRLRSAKAAEHSATKRLQFRWARVTRRDNEGAK